LLTCFNTARWRGQAQKRAQVSDLKGLIFRVSFRYFVTGKFKEVIPLNEEDEKDQKGQKEREKVGPFDLRV
jgi:hypothetical protein